MSAMERERKNPLIRLGTAILYLEGDISKVEITQDAETKFEQRLSEFMMAPRERIIERREPQAKGNFVNGVSKVTNMACQIARDAGRSYVTSADIEESIKRNYCSSWPFCK